MRILKWAIPFVALGLTLVIHAGSAAAYLTPGPTPEPPAGTDGDNILAIVATQFGPAPASPGAADSHGCRWYPGDLVATGLGSIGGLDPTAPGDVKVVNGVTYHIVVRICSDGKPVIILVPTLSAKSLAQAATSRVEQALPHPAVRSAPSTGKGIVNLGMWYWTDPAAYTGKSVTAWIPTPTGILSATTTATPTTLTFTPGEPDAEPVTCSGPGKPWLPEYGDDLPSDCMYTYRHSSEIDPSGTFTARLTITWHISWKSSNGTTGDLDSYDTSTTQAVTIKEIQAIVTR